MRPSASWLEPHPHPPQRPRPTPTLSLSPTPNPSSGESERVQGDRDIGVETKPRFLGSRRSSSRRGGCRATRDSPPLAS